MKPRLIVIGPLPPPYHGVTVSTSLVLANRRLGARFRMDHLDTSDHRTQGVGRWDLTNVTVGLRSAATLLARTGGEPGVVYLPLSQNAGGFLRDSLFIHAAAARGWKVALHLRGGEFNLFYKASPAPLRSWIRASLRRVDSIAVMGSSLRSVFQDLVPPDRIAVVPNGTPEPRTNGVRRGADTVLFLSNLRRRKGVVETFEAALLVVRDHPSARFVFVGEWEDPKLEQDLLARAAFADGRIEFRSRAVGAEKDTLLASAAMLLFPPVEPEGHPRVVLEAIAAGLPVVTTDRGAIAETVVDGKSGFVLPDPAPADLAARVLLLLRDSELRERMGRAARETYLARFTQEQADLRLAEWLEGVAADRVG